MATWEAFAAEAPDLAASAWSLFAAHRHKTLATLRKDGSPRISGTELELVDGRLWLGSMPASVKAADLTRDPRCALHSASFAPSDDPSAWPGDAKVAGRAVQVTDPVEVQRYLDATGAQTPGPFELFWLDLDEVVVTRVGEAGDHLVIESWHDGRGVRRVERR